jgi:hypothetical protein
MSGASLFEGMTAALDDAFGDPVEVIPAAGPSTTVVGQFRENPREVVNPAGLVVTIDTPTLQVAKPIHAALVKGSRVRPEVLPGATFTIVNVHRDRSPAADAYMIFELEVAR